MNPYAATFQSPALSAAPVSGYDNSETPGGEGDDLMPDADEGDDGQKEEAWEGDDEGDRGEYYGYVDYGAARGVGEFGGGQRYHHDGYDPAYHHQVCAWVCSVGLMYCNGLRMFDIYDRSIHAELHT